MSTLPNIPTPPSMYWREFRIRYLPVLVFGAVAVASAILWRYAGVGGGLPAMAEGVRSTVSSPQLGIVKQLKVQPYQLVQAGEPIAVVMPQDPRAQLDMLVAELQIARMKYQPTLAQDNAMNYERIRVELFRTKAEVAIAKVNLQRAENEVRRSEPLMKEKLVSEDIYDLAVQTRDAFKAEVDEKGKAVAEIEKRLNELSGLGVPQAMAANDPMNTMLTRLEGLLAASGTNLAPVTLVAPISGMVSLVYRQAGENVVEGEPLVAISSIWSDRIVGYLRQPFPVDPKVGMEVVVTTRDAKRQEFRSEITQVGAQVEVITNALAFVRTGFLVDAGLPVVVGMPPGIQLRPGEIVDLIIHPRPGLPPRAPTLPPIGAPRQEASSR